MNTRRRQKKEAKENGMKTRKKKEGRKEGKEGRNEDWMFGW